MDYKWNPNEFLEQYLCKIHLGMVVYAFHPLNSESSRSACSAVSDSVSQH